MNSPEEVDYEPSSEEGEVIKNERLETQVKEEPREIKREIPRSPGSTGSIKRVKEETQSPEEQPERKIRKSNEFDEFLSKDTHWCVLRALKDDDETIVYEKEINLVNWEHPIAGPISLYTLPKGDKLQYLKVFKRWRQSKKTGRPVRDDLEAAFRRKPEHLDESWEAFLKKCAAGDITEDIRKRTAGKEKSLYICRQKVHRECTKISSNIPCYIRYREGECQLCGEEDESLDQTRHKIKEYPKEEEWDDEQLDAIYRYEDAHTAHQEAMRRKQASTNYDERGTRPTRLGYPVGGFPTAPRYLSSGNILPSERERSARSSEYAYHDRREPDRRRYNQYDQKSYASSSSREHGGRQSSQQSTYYHRGNPREGVDPDDWETRDSRYYAEDSAPGSSSNRIDRLRDDLYQQSLAGVTAREKLSERITSVERSCHGLADKTASLEKMAGGAREYAKKAHEVAKTTSTHLESHQTHFDQLGVRIGGLEQKIDGIKHVTVKSVEHDRRLSELQTKLESQEQLLKKAQKMLEDQAKVIERLVARVFSESKKDQNSDQEEKSDKP
jgi:hypothetical protein